MRMLKSKLTFYARVILAGLCIILTITAIVSAGLSFMEFKGEDRMKWRPEDGGWEMHLLSTVSEWLLSVCFCGFILSFCGEFRGLSLDKPVLQIEGITKSGTSTGMSSQMQQA